MATVIQNLYIAGDPLDPNATVDVEFNDANGAISRIIWNVVRGVLTVTVKNPPKPDIQRILTAPDSNSLNVPNGYNLTLSGKSGWTWKGTLSAEFRWTAS